MAGPEWAYRSPLFAAIREEAARREHVTARGSERRK